MVDPVTNKDERKSEPLSGDKQIDLSLPRLVEQVSFQIGTRTITCDPTLHYELPKPFRDEDFPTGACTFESLNVPEFIRVIQERKPPLELISFAES